MVAPTQRSIFHYNAAIRALLNSVQGPELVLLTGMLLFTFDNFNGNEESGQSVLGENGLESSTDRGLASYPCRWRSV